VLALGGQAAKFSFRQTRHCRKNGLQVAAALRARHAEGVVAVSKSISVFVALNLAVFITKVITVSFAQIADPADSAVGMGLTCLSAAQETRDPAAYLTRAALLVAGTSGDAHPGRPDRRPLATVGARATCIRCCRITQAQTLSVGTVEALNTREVFGATGRFTHLTTLGAHSERFGVSRKRKFTRRVFRIRAGVAVVQRTAHATACRRRRRRSLAVCMAEADACCWNGAIFAAADVDGHGLDGEFPTHQPRLERG
jgi:hypothetical protein